MRKRSSKPHDPNQLSASIVNEATAELVLPPAPAANGKNPAAVALGRLGGLKGGKARAASLSKKRRSEIARIAAISRWRARQR